jgi:hypothetical protein
MEPQIEINQPLKKRTFLGQPKEQLKEGKRFVENLVSIDHYKALGQILKTNKSPRPSLVEITTTFAMCALLVQSPIRAVASAVFIPYLMYLGPVLNKSYNIMSSKKEDLETIIDVAQKRDHEVLNKFITLLNYNDFTDTEKKDFSFIAKNTNLNLKYYIEKERPKYNTIKNDRLRRIILKQAHWDISDKDLETYHKIESCEKPINKELCIFLKEKGAYNSSIMDFLDLDIKKEHEEMYFAMAEEKYTYIGYYKEALQFYKKADSKGRAAFLSCLKRGALTQAIYNIAWQYKELNKNADYQELTNLVLSKGEKESISNSLNAIRYLSNHENGGDKIANQINNLGKKRKIKLLKSMGPLISLYGSSAIDILQKYLEKGNDNSIDSLLKDVQKEILNKLGVNEINPKLSPADINYLLAGYCKNKSIDSSEKFFSAVFCGEKLWDFRHENNDTINSEWKSGYHNQIVCNLKTKVDKSRIDEQNYTEALEHLNSAGLKIESSIDIQTHAAELILKIKNKTGTLIDDAKGHLEEILKNTRGKEIETSKLIYRTGDLQDFAFIGEYPQNTCLSLTRTNSKYTISMANNSKILPFLVEGITSDSSTVLNRCLLRTNETGIVIDDVYGSKIDMLEEIIIFANKCNSNLIVPTKMLDKFSDKDQKSITDKVKTSLIVETFDKPIYSDTCNNACAGEGIIQKYEAYLIKPSVN